MMGRIAAWIVALALALPLAAGGETTVCILRGAGGEPAFEERFQDWSRRLSAALEKEGGIAPDRIHVLPAAKGDANAEPLTRAAADAAFGELAGELAPDDTFLLFLIGHGSVQQEAKFLVAGPDIAAADFKAWLDALPAERQAVINTTSASAAFINELSQPGRIICTSTRSATERNAPEFMEHFVRALETGRGDADRNGELTLVELCNAAAAATQQWYESEGYIATEHALLDDNGDGLGTRLPLDPAAVGESPDGRLASALIVKPSAARAAADPALVARYDEAIAAVKALRAKKDTMDRDEYWAELEALLLEAARLNRAIHTGERSPPEPTSGLNR